MARSDEFMMTAEELRLHRLKKRRIVVTCGALTIVLIVGFFGGRPMSNMIKAWQARRHASKAFAYIETENWTEARKEATAAYQLRPAEPQSVRAVARFLSHTRQPDALEFWQQLENLTPLTREDRQDEAGIAMVLGETARAEAAVQALLNSKETEPAGWLLAAQLSIQKGAADDAMSALRKVFDDHNANEQQKLQAALLELSLASPLAGKPDGLEGGSAGTDERTTDAWSRIETISRGKSAGARDALVLLAQRALSDQKSQVTSQKSAENPDLPTPSSQLLAPSSSLSQQLANHPLSKAPQKLLALELLEHVDASRRDELIAKGIGEWKNGDPADLLALATWLNGKKEFEKTLATIPIEKALVSRDLFLQYLDALGGLDRWSELKQLLQSDRYPLDPVVQHMYLARCNAQLGEKAAAENNWQRALEAAAGDPGKLITVGEYAEKNGIVDVAKSAFDNAAQVSPKLRFAQQGRLRIAQRSGDTKKIHAVLAEMLKIWPNDAAVQNDEGYTRLLLMGEQQSQRSEDTGQRTDGGKNGRNDEARMSNDEKTVEAAVPAAKDKTTAADTAATTAQRSEVRKENAERPTSNAQRENQKTEDTGQRSDSDKPITNNQEHGALGSRRVDGQTAEVAVSEREQTNQLITLGQLAEKLVEKNPRSLPHRTFLALARLKQNRAADALAVYENVTVARNALTPSALAVHAAVLAANGKMDDAKAEAQQIRTDQLLTQERQLIADLSY